MSFDTSARWECTQTLTARVEGAGRVRIDECEGERCEASGPRAVTVSVLGDAQRGNTILTIDYQEADPAWAPCLASPFPLDAAVEVVAVVQLDLAPDRAGPRVAAGQEDGVRGGERALDALGVRVGIRGRQPGVLQDVGLPLISPSHRRDAHGGAITEGLADRRAACGGPGRETRAPGRPQRRELRGPPGILPGLEDRRAVVSGTLEASARDRSRQQGVVGRGGTLHEQREVAPLILAEFVD